MEIDLGPEVRTAAIQCARCKKKLDAATGVEKDGHEVREGAISVCAYCGNIAIFNADMTLRAIDEKERAELMAEIKAADPDLHRFLLTTARIFETPWRAKHN